MSDCWKYYDCYQWIYNEKTEGKKEKKEAQDDSKRTCEIGDNQSEGKQQELEWKL